MLSGGGSMAVFYLIGYLVNGKFSGYELLSLHPFIWSVLVSALVMLAVGRNSPPAEKSLKGVGAPQDPNDPDSPLLGLSSVPADHNWDEWPKEFGALAATGF